jgi:hypothetical protein
VIDTIRSRLTYANVVATAALFMALGGTSYAVFRVGSADVVDNSLRSRDLRDGTVRGRDIRDRALRARDIGLDKLGSGVIKESTLGTVPTAINAERLDGVTAQDLKLKCPRDTLFRAGVCLEISPRNAQPFLAATDICDQAGRGLPSMPELDRFARVNGPLAQREWTGSVYRNAAAGTTPLEELEAVVLDGVGNVSYDGAYAAVQHAFRCVALPSN